MEPANPQKDPPDTANESASADTEGTNGHGVWPGPTPMRIAPELLDRLLTLWDEEDDKRAAADLRKLLDDGGGVSSEELLRTIEQAVRDDG
jgi:hypothetical protein